jgi:hypothetical protein
VTAGIVRAERERERERDTHTHTHIHTTHSILGKKKYFLIKPWTILSIEHEFISWTWAIKMPFIIIIISCINPFVERKGNVKELKGQNNIISYIRTRFNSNSSVLGTILKFYK